ncbi:MAG: hypothetical protein WC423_22625, partial [Vulcanimicrobiota bacterium]
LVVVVDAPYNPGERLIEFIFEGLLRMEFETQRGDFAACRSPKTQHVDHSKRGKSITHFAGSRSLVSDEVDQ